MLYVEGKKRIVSYMLVAIQFVAIFMIFITGPWFPQHPALLVVYLLGIIIGFWSIYTMDTNTINVPPDVRPTATLTSHGPYFLIRHPMYLSLLLVSIPLVILKPTIFRIAIQTTLFVDLLFKIHFEEIKLVNQLEGYQFYKKNTWKLLPFIY